MYERRGNLIVDIALRGVVLPAMAFSALMAGLYFAVPVMFWLIVLAVIVAVVVNVRISRRRRVGVVLGYLEQAVRLNLPLPVMMHTASLSERGAMRRRLERLRWYLEGGNSLARSLEMAFNYAPAGVIGLIGAAERTGQLAPTLSRLAEQYRRTDDRGDAQVMYLWIVPPAVLLVGMFVALGMAVLIMPRITDVLGEYGATPPAATRMLMNAGAALQPLRAALMLLGLSLGLFLWVLLVMHISFPGGLRHTAVRSVVGGVAWRVPGLRGRLRDAALSQMCGVIESALRGGLPLHSALNEASQLQVAEAMRRRAARWAEAMASGRTPADAARAAGMPRLLVGLVATAERGRGLAEAFGFLRRHYERRLNRAVELLRGAAVPASVMITGLLVGWFVFAMFMPMIALIEAAIGDTGLMP